MADLYVCSHGNTKPCDECRQFAGVGIYRERIPPVSEQPTCLVNCCCCGQSGERHEMYRDKIEERFACVDLNACLRRQDEYVRTHRADHRLSPKGLEAIRRHAGYYATTTSDDDRAQREHAIRVAEVSAVRELGERVGYGNMMHLARDEWRTSLLKQDHAGGEFAVGPCVALTVPCGCDYPCDWCNGCGWITPKVAELRLTLNVTERDAETPTIE